MKEPPESVALLKRMAVSKKHQRRGIASAMMDTALDHCRAYKFRAIELITTEHHEAARNLYARKGFELIASYEKISSSGWYLLPSIDCDVLAISY